MRRLGLCVGALVLALAACKQPAATPAGPKATVRPAASRSGPSPTPTTPASAAAPAVLQKPATPTVALAGKVAVDASYVVRAGTGSVVGGRLITDAGGSLLSNNAGNIISDHASGLVSNNSGNIISDHAAGRTLLAAEAPAYGAMLPAGGMEVGLRSLRTGKALPVGVGPDGTPVYGIFTDADGAYTVYVPAEEQGSVLVEARVPATDDPRQRYQLIARPAEAGAKVVDEDTAQLTRYVRQAFVAQIYRMLTQVPDVTICSIAATPAFPQQFKAALSGTIPEVYAAATAAGIRGTAEQATAAQALAARCADLVMAQVDLDAVTLDTSTEFWGTRPGEGPDPALAAAVTGVRAFREAVTQRLAAEPTYFDDQQFFRLANACKPGTYVIKKPADATAFLVDEYMSDNRSDAFQWADIVIGSLGTPPDARGVAADRRINAAGVALAQRTALAFFGDEGGCKAACLDLIRAFDPAHPVPDGVEVPPARPQTCPHPYADGYSEDGCDKGAPTPPP